MSKILSQNPIRFNIDTLKTDKHALITMKSGNFLDCTNATSINGFNISYSQPENTRIAFVFTTGNEWFKLNSDGTALSVESQSLTYESVLEEGNTISELQALDNIPAFKGHRVRVAIALLSSDPNVAPSVSLSIKATNTTQQLTKTEYSPLYDLGDNAQIINIITNSQVSNNGAITIQGCIDESDNWQALIT